MPTSMLRTRDISDDSWVDHIEKIQEPFGAKTREMAAALVHTTGEWPTELLRARRYKGRKQSSAINRATLFLRLSKLVQFAYVAVLIFCGVGPATMAVYHHEPKYLVFSIFILMIPPLWLLENLLFSYSRIGRHSEVMNNDDRVVRLYNVQRDVKQYRKPAS